MESSESFRFCRVCLVPEEIEEGCQKTHKFRSIFDNFGQMAQKLHNISGILPIDVDEKVPSLICIGCTKEVFGADLLKKRILDANEHIVMMTAEKEIEVFESELKELRRKLKLNKQNEKPKTPEENMLKMFENTSKFYVPKVFLDRIECDDKMVEYLKLKSSLIDKKPKDSKKMNLETKAMLRKPTVDKKTVKALKHPRESSHGVDEEKVEKKTEKTNNFKKKKKQKLEKEVAETPLEKPPKHKKTSLAIKRVQTLFECDSCKEYYFSYRELDNHKAIHRCK